MVIEDPASPRSYAVLAKLLRLWGKTGQGGTFHPALFHMLDVGHVAEVLLGREATPRFRTVLARALSVDGPDLLAGWLPLLIALHDVGKVSAPFQGQAGQPRTRAERERLQAEGFDFGRTGGDRYPHAQIGAVFTQLAWPHLESGLPRPLVLALRDAIGGHHGEFASGSELSKVSEYLRFEEPPVWSELRSAAYTTLRERLAPGWRDGLALPTPQHRTAATMALAGFTILCDWIGSDAECFPIEPRPLSLDSYAQLSRERAQEAVERIGFAPVRPSVVYRGFGELFPNKEHVRPLQKAIDELPEFVLTQPGLYIIEAPTGEGKTEAALALAQRLAAAGASDELYFALPTTATSNQMFGRVQSFINGAKGGNGGSPVKLVHGQAFLVEDDLLLRLHDDADRGDATGASAAHEWFAPRKRALLAPFGVGTVDQVELTSLQARHYMLRLFSLAGKVVIIDEVHAYDTYISTVLHRVLEWLAALGSSVILLSATLPTSRHGALARSFARAAPAPRSNEDVGCRQGLPYPCIAAYTDSDSVLLSPPAAQPERRLRVEFVNDDTPRDQAQRLLDLTSGGGAICRICNTVAEAQAVFQAVDEMASDEVQRVLLHSRFPLEERQELEAQVAVWFGPNSPRKPHERYIVIGTQVLEQSLDLDFDVMITDLAPVDLLLQRAGRLHRHVRDRAWRHRAPVLGVQLRRTSDGFPDFGAWGWVYYEFILWRSLLVLQERTDPAGQIELSLPSDYRSLIEATYSEDDYAMPQDSLYSGKMRAAYERYLKEQAKESGEARLRLVPEPTPDSGIAEGTNIQFEEDSDGGKQGWGIAKTRLGAESITVIPLHRNGAGDILTLHTDGADPLGPGCDRACQLQLLRRSIPVSHPGLVARLLTARSESPRWFRDAALLRHAAPLILDGGVAQYDDLIVTLDPRLGLVTRKETQG